MLEREGSKQVQFQIFTMTTFYAFKPPNDFDPWSEELYQLLLNNILDLVEDTKFKDLNLELV